MIRHTHLNPHVDGFPISLHTGTTHCATSTRTICISPRSSIRCRSTSFGRMSPRDRGAVRRSVQDGSSPASCQPESNRREQFNDEAFRRKAK